MKKLKILITGGAGLLGSEIIKILLAQKNCEIYALDIADNPLRLKDVSDKIEYIKSDITDFAIVEKIFKKLIPDRVFHLSAILGADSESKIDLAFNVNVLATFNLFKLCCEIGVRQIVFASSVSTFSLDINNDTIDDDTLQRPISFYGVAKLFGEGLGLFFKRKTGIDFRGIRYPYIIGKDIGLRKGGILDYPATLIENSLNGRETVVNVPEELKIPIIYIKDAARATVELSFAKEENIKKRIYLICGVKPTPSAKELSDTVKKLIPKAKIFFKPDRNVIEILKYFSKEIDDSNAKNEWNWTPEFESYEKIVKEFIGESI